MSICVFENKQYNRSVTVMEEDTNKPTVIDNALWRTSLTNLWQNGKEEEKGDSK